MKDKISFIFMRRHHKKAYSLARLLFSTFSAISVLLLLTITICITANFSRTFTQLTYNKYESVFEQSNSQLSMIFHNVGTLASVLDNTPEIIAAVNLSLHSSDPYTRLKNEALVQKQLITASNYYSYINNIYIFKQDKVFYMHDSTFAVPPAQLKDEPWFPVAAEKNFKQMVVPYNERYFIYLHPFHNTLLEENPGIMMIFLDSAMLRDCLRSVGSDSGAIICAFDSDGNLLYTENEEYRGMLEKYHRQLTEHQSGLHISLDHTKYLLTRETNTFADWTLISLIPGDLTYQSLVPIFQQMFPIILLILAVGLCLIYLLSRSITKTFYPLLQSMKRSAKGDFSFEPYQTQVEEINTLIDGYGNMLIKLSNLITRIKTIETEKRRTELEILQAQISPHFTYNTLNSIRYLALMQESPKIADVISSFSTLLQITASHPNEFITVEEELKEVSCYIEIMNFRYNSLITVLWEIEDSARAFMTLKLVMQPLVENCFCHAFPGTSQEGQIIIRVYHREATLYFEVEDNGCGFAYNGTDLPSPLTDGHHNVGLMNIQKRLHLWFGEQYGLSIRSGLQKGTLVILTQPIQEDKNKEEGFS